MQIFIAQIFAELWSTLDPDYTMIRTFLSLCRDICIVDFVFRLNGKNKQWVKMYANVFLNLPKSKQILSYDVTMMICTAIIIILQCSRQAVMSVWDTALVVSCPL